MEDGTWMVITKFNNIRIYNNFYFILTLFSFFLITAVFHVTDINGNKLNDQSVLKYIEQVIS